MLTIYNVDIKNNGVYHLRTIYNNIRLCGYTNKSIYTIYDVYNWVEIERFDEYIKKFEYIHLDRDI